MRRGVAILVALLLGGAAAAQEGVSETRHNLSVSGPGPVRSVTEDRICIFCHASHLVGADTAVWNHQTSPAVSYTPYDSHTLGERPGQPDGSSRLCLSCHDGTIAVGAVRTEPDPIRMRGTGLGGRLGPGQAGYLGTDLSGDHPVSVLYQASASQRTSTGAVTWLHPRPQGPGAHPRLLDEEGRVQCVSCHDPHEDRSVADPSLPPFWQGSDFSTVCTTCHQAPLTSWSHADPSQLLQGCGSCHVGHGVSATPLLPAREEAACYRCHGSPQEVRQARDEGLLGPADPVRIDDLFDRPHRHPVELSSGPGPRPEPGSGYVECVDCHPVHGEPATDPGGGFVAPGTRATADGSGPPGYLLCYECHAGPARRPYGQTDKSTEFDPSNASYHPVEARAASAGSPSLLSPWMAGDLMTCSDCHGGEDARRGPHGSRNPGLLRRGYVASDGALESPSTYALCYECHSRSSILSNESFEGHAAHVLDAATSCYSCHDSHGSRDYPGLIRFGKDIRLGEIVPSGTGRLEYEPRTRSCYLTCHGVDHDPLGYR